jgi:hypothetical protein
MKKSLIAQNHPLIVEIERSLFISTEASCCERNISFFFMHSALNGGEIYSSRFFNINNQFCKMTNKKQKHKRRAYFLKMKT